MNTKRGKLEGTHRSFRLLIILTKVLSWRVGEFVNYRHQPPMSSVYTLMSIKICIPSNPCIYLFAHARVRKCEYVIAKVRKQL